MTYRMMGWTHVRAARLLRREEGQGTVEYVGVMLLLATVLAAVVKVSKDNDFQLAGTITKEIKEAIGNVGAK